MAGLYYRKNTKPVRLAVRLWRLKDEQGQHSTMKTKLHIPPEPLGLKLQMQKMFFSQAKTVQDRKEWREAIRKTKADIKKYGIFRGISLKKKGHKKK